MNDARKINGYESPEEALEALRAEMPNLWIDEADIACCDHCGKWYDAAEDMYSLDGDRWVTGHDGSEALMATPATCIPCAEEDLRALGIRPQLR